VEHNPSNIWQSVLKTVSKVLNQSGIPSTSIVCVGIANQGESVIAWNRKTGQPFYNVIVWQDRRTESVCQELISKGWEPKVRAKTGLMIDPYFSATKMRCLLDHITENFPEIPIEDIALGTLDSWLIWKMTGGKSFFTDYATASRTMLYNIDTLLWDRDMLFLFGIPENVLPVPRSSSGFFGKIDETIIPGLSAPILGSTVDQQGALFGQGCFNFGDTKVTYGTGGFMLMNTGRKKILSQKKLLTSLAASLDKDNRQYVLDGGIYCVGTAIKWAKESLGIINEEPESETLAANVKTPQGVFFVPALTGLAAPYWNSQIKGAFLGLTPATGKAEIMRAILESIVFRVKEIFEIVTEESNVEIQDIHVDGGVAKNNFLMQLQANLLGIPIHRPKITEVTALGVAQLAGLAGGIWKELDEFKENHQINRIFYPEDDRELLKRYHIWKRAIRLISQFEK